jgi:hypothetical protein
MIDCLTDCAGVHPPHCDDCADGVLVVVCCACCVLSITETRCSQGYQRIGTLVLLVHDVSDSFLEAAKCCKYMKVRCLLGSLTKD